MLVYLINTVLGNAASEIYVPDLYRVNGTFRIPVSNITQPFEAKIYLSKNMGFISYYDNLTFNVFTSNQTYHVYTMNDTKGCDHSFNGGINTGMTTMLPDLSKNWTELPKVNVKGVICRHFRLHGIDGVNGDNNSTYNFFETDQQDYYCANGTELNNKTICIPQLWVISGYNTNGGSHYDFYQIDYDEFDYMPTFNESIFVTPKECNTSQDSKDVHMPFSNREIKGFEEFLNFKQKFSENKKYKPSFQIQYHHRLHDGYENFIKKFTGHLHTKNDKKSTTQNIKYKIIDKRQTSDPLPRDFDLRTKGIMQPVKDQAVCGSCWTFGSGGTLEGRINWFQHKNGAPLVKVSEQQILSCTWKKTGIKQNHGCNGGNHDAALQVLIDKFGGKVPVAKKSPYLGYEGKCESDAFTDQFGIISAVNNIKTTLSVNEKTQLLKEALLKGPVAVSIAVPKSLAYYSGGVYNDPACGYGSRARLVHSVVAVGWGNDTEFGDYWIIRNSWSSAWGQDGYVYIKMDNDLCGVLQNPTYPEISYEQEIPTFTEYQMSGTFELPYSNITQQLSVFYSQKNKRQVINWFNFSDYQVWDLNNNAFYGVLTYKPENASESQQYCTLKPQLGLNNTQLMKMLPDLSQNWTEINNYTVNNYTVRQFRLTSTDSNPPDIPRLFRYYGRQLNNDNNHSEFTQGQSDEQNFFCRQEVDGSCTPLKWEFFGYNTLQGSHYDYYVLTINSYKTTSTYENEDIFNIPQKCGNNDNQFFTERVPTNSKWLLHFTAQQQKQHNVKNNLAFIAAENRKVRSHKLTPNKFTHYDFETFINTFTGYKHAKSYQMQNIMKVDAQFDENGAWYINQTTGIKTAFPKHIDWRMRGGVGSVRDQANCGSCWAFGTAAAIEMRLNILNNDTKKPNIQVSEQSIVDCIWSQNLHGCDGGFAAETLDRIIKDYNGNIAITNDYPYLGQDLKCDSASWAKNKQFGRIIGYNILNSTGALKYALLKGPITAAIKVTPSMMFYSGGIFDDPACKNATENDLNHQITVVGYNTLNGVEYFIIRNSWSAAWGQDGHIYLPASNDCGLKLQGTEVIVEADQNIKQ